MGRALAAGAERLSFGIAEWDVSGSCTDPYLRITIGRPHITGRKFVTVGPGKRTTLEVRMWLPCSRCDRCRARLAYGWRKRAEAELDLSSRTWFGTLTFKPSERYVLLARASMEYGPGFDGLPEQHRFRLIEREAYKLAQKYWKRVRKETGHRLRYIMVAEAHADGSLHYHALVHERAGNEIRHHTLTKQWMHGFTKWKLTNRHRGVAHYVTKYLTKSNASRTRASQHYGFLSRVESGNEMTQKGNTLVFSYPTSQTLRASGTAGQEREQLSGRRGQGPPAPELGTELTGVKDG